MKKTVILFVLDGWGHREDHKDNAILAAETPVFDNLWKTYPHTLLKASGLAVGLPEGQIGNSEIGHTAIGAGTVVYTDLVRINKEIEDGKFGENQILQKAFKHVKDNNSTLHLLGLVSHGGVHSSEDHLLEIIRQAKKFGVSQVAIHVFTDGRDVGPESGSGYVKELEDLMADLHLGQIHTLSGRYYAMDRDHNYDRTAKAEQAIFLHQGQLSKLSPSEQLKESYRNGITDEYVEPVVFGDQTKIINENDAIFFFNFRADRARQLSERIVENIKAKNIYFASMTDYGDEFSIDSAYPDIEIKETLGKVISDAGLKQTHVAETEKFAHATYFLNGGREDPYKNEKQIIIPSRKDVKTHDQAPEMKAKEIADVVIKEIEAGQDFIFINFANADMVGHTSNVPAIVVAVETVDRELGRILEALEKTGGVAFVTADHGNAELNKDTEGNPHTAHTTNLVPAIITDKILSLKDGGGLANVAPTILEIMGLTKPVEMQAESLLLTK